VQRKAKYFCNEFITVVTVVSSIAISVIYFAVLFTLLGCGKLGVSASGCRVVLEENGREIDADEALQALSNQKLMILQVYENWTNTSEQNKHGASQTTQDENKGTCNSFLTRYDRSMTYTISMRELSNKQFCFVSLGHSNVYSFRAYSA